MTRRKLEDKNIRKISRIGNRSLGVTLPVEMLKDLGWFTLLNREAKSKSQTR